MSGIVSHLKGAASEDQVAMLYEKRGATIVARRWMGDGGEIDLICEQAGQIIFIEVKSSATIARALESLGPRQIKRLLASASDFLSRQPSGALTDMRFDVAAVDGTGRIEIVENALMV